MTAQPAMRDFEHATSPAAPAALYAGTVMHARMKPKAHRFTYQVVDLLIDLDRLAEAGRMTPLFKVNARAPVSFHERDHGDGNGDLAAYVRRLFAGNGFDAKGHRLHLWCYPRVAGFVFNPLSVYYASTPDGRLDGLIYEVRNTFGERHTYVCKVAPDERHGAGVRQSRAKIFYVSPFMDMPMRYHFRLGPPGETMQVRILETDADGPILAATFSGRRRALTTASILTTLAALPVQTLKVVGGIHYEALKLWWKGVALFPRPVPPPPVSHRDAVRDGLAPN
jgi:uncharacterized protein